MATGSLDRANWLDRCDLGCFRLGAVYVANGHSYYTD